MAELADAPDLGSGPARGGGSSPPFRTNHWVLGVGFHVPGLKRQKAEGRRQKAEGSTPSLGCLRHPEFHPKYFRDYRVSAHALCGLGRLYRPLFAQITRRGLLSGGIQNANSKKQKPNVRTQNANCGEAGVKAVKGNNSNTGRQYTRCSTWTYSRNPMPQDGHQDNCDGVQQWDSEKPTPSCY